MFPWSLVGKLLSRPNQQCLVQIQREEPCLVTWQVPLLEGQIKAITRNLPSVSQASA